MNPKITKKAGIILLAVIIVVQLVFTIFTFAFKKEGVHSDEPWSYGLANSNYKPFVYLKEGVNIDEAKENDYDNLNKWISSDVLHDYITVQKGERFNYKSVYDNQKYDHHPPLYYMVLHTICSFFPDKFSYWYGFFINCIALVFTQIYLYKLGMLITKGKPYMALLICLLYGGGVGAMSTFTFVRMYAMVTALSTAHIYYQFRLYYSEDFNIKKNILPVIITGILGALTENMFIIIMGLCTACLCIWLLCKKKIKKMFIFGFTMLGTLGVALAIFPYTITQTLNFSKKDSHLPEYSSQFKSFLSYITQQNLGFDCFFDSLIIQNIFLGFILFLLLCYLFRQKKPFSIINPKIIKLFNSAKEIILYVFRNLKTLIKKVCWPVVFIIAIVIGYCAISAKMIDVSVMGIYSSRYVMPLFPLICVAAVILIHFLAEHFSGLKKHTPAVCSAFVVIMIVASNITSSNAFLFTQPDDYKDLSEITKGQKCEVVLHIPWRMTCFAGHLRNCSQVKFSDIPHFYDGKNKTIKFDGAENNQTVYLIIDSTKKGMKNYFTEKRTVKILKKNPDVNSIKLEGHIFFQGGNCSIYKIN